MKNLGKVVKLSTSQSTPNSRHLTDEKTALLLTKALLGFYPDRGQVDVDMFKAAVKELFMSFPESSGRRVINPLTGLPSKLKWFPSIAEIADALKAETPGWGPSGLASDRLNRELEEQVQDRKALEHQKPSVEERLAFVKSMGCFVSGKTVRVVDPDLADFPDAEKAREERDKVAKKGLGNIEAGYLIMMNEAERGQ